MFGSVVREKDIIQAYQAVLGRLPENKEVIRDHQKRGSLQAVIKALIESDEFSSKFIIKNPKHDLISAKDILRRHELENRSFSAGYITNFIGVDTNVRFCGWTSEGVESDLPVPGNFHATFTEWAAALRAVDLARQDFTVIELGAGWGCWMVNTAVAAKRRGLTVKAIGVEGDEAHVSYIAQHCAKNGLTPAEFRVERCVAWGGNGFAAFPRSDNANSAYGQEPRFFETAEDVDAFVASSGCNWDVLPAKTLETIAADIARIDLLHIDIQGGESALIKAALPALNDKVAYIVVGTHGRQIEGEIIALLSSNGWILEIEEPCTLPTPLAYGLPYVDGVQGWRNAKLAGAEGRIP
jgi:hypothetical protein